MRRDRIWRIGPAGLALVLAMVACSDSNKSPTAPQTSDSVISNLQIRPLTGQFSNRTVQYRITTTVTNPEGVVGGTAQLKTTAVAERRKQTSVREDQAVVKTAIVAQNVVGDQLSVTLAFDHPSVGIMRLTYSVLDARGLETNGIPLVIGIDEPPPPPPPPLGPSFAETIGPTFLHPRCTNCHGFNVPNVVGIQHIARPPTCSLCHLVPTWGAPAASFDLASKSLSQICDMIKVTKNNSAVVIGDHLKSDPLIQWAIIDGTVEGNLQPGGKAPPKNLGIWNGLVDQWIGGGLRCD